MAPGKRTAKSKPATQPASSGAPPVPYRRPPDVLAPFIAALDKKHVYITHIDAKPASFKRRIFLVPVAMNVCTAILFVWRMYAILPWYWELLKTSFGRTTEDTFSAADATWAELAWVIGSRAIVFIIDFFLFVYIWPWPVEFTLASLHGNPTRWRWNVGFRDQEIYVRRSRDWDTALGDFIADGDGQKIFSVYVRNATAPLLQEQKTGYLLMNSQWDLDWEAMVVAHSLVDKKDIALNAFKNLVLVHHQQYGWLCYDLKLGESADEDTRRRQIFAFRDALTAMGKEDLFYRWIEIVQFEATQPGGFGPEKQEVAAKKIRDLFEAQGIVFDELWKEAVGTDNSLGI
ncbi:hypothetical protein S7711_02175 [Stachybotrys chartarum IBT 7711]|uniref:Uncharacterized protein n=1 Tax=Stachybotrys chartarum (strain CBS 109288 / IBT 7711) TaxID=1280523 RepID=A0A084ARP1_STACB|nr:hypothetical protein S7711_02175 [Stachybotrys chartarum IBT 7711]KFA47980.1 hypothetical protein S40293_02697 [Stachybotrys chartarum IBT 40293]